MSRRSPFVEGLEGSYLPRLGVWDLLPGHPIVIPQEASTAEGEAVWAWEVHRDLQKNRLDALETFLREELALGRSASSDEVLVGLEDFMVRLEASIGKGLWPHDVTALGGALDMADSLCATFRSGPLYSLTDEAAQEVLGYVPPVALMTTLGVGSMGELLARVCQKPAAVRGGEREEEDSGRVAAGDVLAMADWTEGREYGPRVLDVLLRHGSAAWLQDRPLRAVVAARARPRRTSTLARLAGRVVAGSVDGGVRFPRLLVLFETLRRIVSAELLSSAWRGWARDDPSTLFGPVAASLAGHHGWQPTSARRLCEGQGHMIVAARLEAFAEERSRGEGGAVTEAARLLGAAARVLHVATVLRDGTYVSLSARSWAFHAARGGHGPPPPQAAEAERDRAARDFLGSFLSRTGLGTAADLDRTCLDMVGQGRGGEDATPALLGAVSYDSPSVLAGPWPSVATSAAGRLCRVGDGPILEPRPEHPWESRYVLNAGALRLGGDVYILYRAYGDDEISRIGLARSAGGVRIDERLDEPIFGPADAAESAGCEDPRVTVIDGRVFMLYTAWDLTLPQIAMASMGVEDFLARRWDRWVRHGLALPGLSNKDAVIFPRKVRGRYVIYHRVAPAMWSFSLDELRCPWPAAGHRVFARPGVGQSWDAAKIGAGAPPMETTLGWLHVVHGVDLDFVYRLGVMVTALDDPSRVVFRSREPVLEPELPFEVGTGPGDHWVPRVVFSCGAVPARDAPRPLGRDDEILVYYGGADTAIGVARARVGDLVPC